MVETAAVLSTTIDEVHRSSNDDSVDTLVRLDQENGGGYMGSLEMFHQLHCLVSEIIYQSNLWLTAPRTFFENGPTWTITNIMILFSCILHITDVSTRVRRSSNLAVCFLSNFMTDHCIDIIRQVLMCNGDMGLVMFHWIHGMAVPTPDFNTMVSYFPFFITRILIFQHSCRDPEAILQWAISRKASISHSIERVAGQKDLTHSAWI